jgi:hypothetical protein
MARRAGGVCVLAIVCAGMAGGQEPPGAARGWYKRITSGGPSGGTGTASKRICFGFDPFSAELDDATLAKAQQMSAQDPSCPGGVSITRPFRPQLGSYFEFAAPLDGVEPAPATGVVFAGLLFNVKLEKGTVRVVLLRRKRDAAGSMITHLYLEPQP